MTTDPLNSLRTASPTTASASITPSTHSSSQIDYAYLRQLVMDQSQNILDPSRDYLFESRLSKLLRFYNLASLTELIELLQTRRDPSMERSVAQAMTINETSFFRDGRPFELLRTQLLPELIEKRCANRSLRIWSAACSTGQEAYSLAILLLSDFAQLANWNIRIEGSDISVDVIERSRKGSYHRIEIERGLSSRNLLRFFDQRGEEWTVKPELRALCNFRQANLCAPQFPYSRQTDNFDIIFLRNVMLYFSQESRKRLLSNVHRLLAPDGILFLGASEQPADPTLWTPTLAGGTCYFRPRPAA